ncbi:hypothetical protein CBER1_01054 [Cercospora berteroae]|uniref:Uncharacterized protein n=1 Tax=Cercospora berteroae TaxID=357750 RepID=A0A2S6C323_9PEZI|nr:hypothetical protein CBER1_01054 [Cercospora berteroae]
MSPIGRVLVCALGWAHAVRSQRCNTLPQNEYAQASPSSQGFDSAKLQDALNYASVMGSSSIKVFRHGCLVGSGLRDPLLERVPELNAGQTKTVVALLAGIVAGRGWVDIDAPIDQYVEPGLGDAAHRNRTLRNFMNLVAGQRVNHVTGLNLFADISRYREYFSTELLRPAGEYYEFDEITPSVVTHILERQVQLNTGTNVDFQDFAQTEPFNKLGIPRSAYFWQKDRAGDTTGYSGLWLRPLEYGRLGLLMLNEGAFGGRQIVPAGFIRQMRQGTTANCGFGVYAWLNSCKPGEQQVNTDYLTRRLYSGEAWVQSAPSDMWYSLGLGTNTFVIPSLDMVVSRAGYQELDTIPGALNLDLHGAFPGNAGGPGEHEFFRRLMAAVTDMPADVRATIQNSGPYNRPADNNVDTQPFLVPLDAAVGSYLGVGPHAAEGCNALRCNGADNDGLLYLLQIPRTGLGLIGLERRPSG